MVSSQIRAVIPCRRQMVWQVVTDVERYPSWRSGLSRVAGAAESRFIEYTDKGYETVFTTTLWEPCRRWEFDMENSGMKGRWSGVFIQRPDGTEVRFTEYVQGEKLFLRPLIRAYLKRQQAKFLSDLKRVLSLYDTL